MFGMLAASKRPLPTNSRKNVEVDSLATSLHRTETPKFESQAAAMQAQLDA
jgi:hypothetical protein